MLRLSACVAIPWGLGILLGPSAPAQASPPEVFGFGSRSAALGGAVAARADDFSAVHYNPAGLGFSRGKHVTFGLTGFTSNLAINDGEAELSDPAGVVLGATTPAPLGGALKNRVFVGIGMYLLPTKAVRILAHLPDEPFYPWYDNRTQRVVILPGMAVRVAEKVSLGIAFNVLAGLGGQVVAAEGPTRVLEARVDENIPTSAKLHVGLRARVLPQLDLGVVFRQAFSVPFTTVADTTVAGEPIDLLISAEGLYTPNTVVLGWAFRSPIADLSLDLSYALWSLYEGPFVAVDSNLPLVGPLEGVLPDVPWENTYGVRFGAEKRLDLGGGAEMALRGGYAFESSPVPAEQPGVTNLLDGPKHTASAGVGWRWRIAAPKAGKPARWLRLDLHLAAQIVGARTLEKRLSDEEDMDPFDGLRDEVTDDQNEPSTIGIQVSNPGYPRITSGGQVFSGGLMMEIEL